MTLYTVIVDDSFHWWDPEYRYELGPFSTEDEALAVCVDIVERYLLQFYKPGMSAEELFDCYATYGDEPFVVSEPPEPDSRAYAFEAWHYARQRAQEMCAAPGGGVLQ